MKQLQKGIEIAIESLSKNTISIVIVLPERVFGLQNPYNQRNLIENPIGQEAAEKSAVAISISL